MLPIPPLIFIVLSDILLISNYKINSAPATDINNLLDNNITILFPVKNYLETIEAILLLINLNIL